MILSVRDSPEAWAKSVHRTISRFGPLVRHAPARYTVPEAFAEAEEWIWRRIGVERAPNGTLLGLEAAYVKWIAQVKVRVSRDDHPMVVVIMIATTAVCQVGYQEDGSWVWDVRE